MNIRSHESNSPVRRRPKIGDVLAFKAGSGYGHALITHDIRDGFALGTLVRVIRGIRETPDFRGDVEASTIQFSAFTPVRSYCHRGDAWVVARNQTLNSLADLPIFKCIQILPPDSVGRAYSLWDGKREWPVEKLTAEQRNYPICEIIGLDLLVDRLLSNWTPRDER